jgi:F-type H+-transporting ATPase subunit b
MLRKLPARMMFIAAMTLPAASLLAAPAEAAAQAKEAEPGLLDLSTSNMVAAIWVLSIFIILAIVLYRTAWKNVLAGLKAREARIRNDIAQAEATRAKAEATLKEYTAQLATAEQKVRDLLSKAATDAEQLATSLRTRAQQDAEEIKERATKEIEAARDQALTEIYQQTAELATSVAEKILRRNLNANDQRDLVNQSLSELQHAGVN